MLRSLPPRLLAIQSHSAESAWLKRGILLQELEPLVLRPDVVAGAWAAAAASEEHMNALRLMQVCSFAQICNATSSEFLQLA